MFAVVAARPPLRAAVGKARVLVEATPALLRCAAGVDVRVTSTWQERDAITAVDAQSVSINSRQRTALTIETPRRATVRGKVEGDRIDVRGSTIDVDSVRGETVRLMSSSGGVASTKLVEGLEVDISGTSITLAKLQASHANIRGDDVSIVAAYCRKLDVDATGASAVDAIQIDAAHGHVTAKATNGGVSLQRCSGSCSVEAAGTVSLAFDAMNGDAVACSDRGDVDVSVAPSIACDVELEGLRIDCAGAPMLRRSVDEAELVKGALEAVREPSRAGAGKVNVDGASQQKWDSSFISDEGGRPRIVAHAPKGHVALRALSWIDAIRRKVGLPEGFEKVRRTSS
jgi:hypothetical protein